MNKSNAELESLIKGFEFTCQAEGKSAKTIEWYSSFLDRFWHFLERSNLPTDLTQLDRNHIRAFIRYLQTEAKTPHKLRPLSGATVQGYVRTLKAFFSWATREGYLPTNPVAMIPIPKATTKIVSTFTSEHIATLASMCSTSNGNGCRNLTIILLLLDSGLRVSELVSLDVSDVDLTEGHIRVRRAKGNKERLVPMGSLVQKWLWKYINYYRPSAIMGHKDGPYNRTLQAGSTSS